MPQDLRIYIASPYGFAESTREFMGRLVQTVRHAGFVPVNPWDFDITKRVEEISALDDLEEVTAAWRTLNREIGERNRRSIEECDLMLACLDGPDVDSGTASEIGYAFALGKGIQGYRGDFRLTGDNLGSRINLQVQYWIEASGGGIAATLDTIPAALHLLKSHIADSKRRPSKIGTNR